MTTSAQEFLVFLNAAASSASTPKTLAEFREQFDGLTDGMIVPDGVCSNTLQLGGVDVLHQRAAHPSADTILLHCHGGGYVFGSPQTHAQLTGHFALQTGGDVYSLDYRLAPENPWPAAVEDVCSVYQDLLSQEKSTDRIFFSGDSAGGGLVLAALSAAKDLGLPMPAGLILLSPWCDLTNSGWSHSTMADRDFMCNAGVLTTCAAYYTGGIEPEGKTKSPLFGDLSQLPPMSIHVGSEEVLLSDSTRLAARAGATGVPIDLKVWPLMPHVFPLFVDHLAEARQCIGEIADWIRAHSPNA